MNRDCIKCGYRVISKLSDVRIYVNHRRYNRLFLYRTIIGIECEQMDNKECLEDEPDLFNFKSFI